MIILPIFKVWNVVSIITMKKMYVSVMFSDCINELPEKGFYTSSLF